MNIDEIIKALETEVLCENCPHNGSECLQCGCYYIEASKIIKELKSRAEKAEARAEAAINEIRDIDKLSGKCIRCKSWNGVRCKRGYSVNASFCNDWEWRGVQDKPEVKGEE